MTKQYLDERAKKQAEPSFVHDRSIVGNFFSFCGCYIAGMLFHCRDVKSLVA